MKTQREKEQDMKSKKKLTKQNTRNLAIQQTRNTQLWVPAEGRGVSLLAALPHHPGLPISLSPYFLCYAWLHGKLHHRSLILSLLSADILSTPCFLPFPICLSFLSSTRLLLLTQSSDCTGPHQHSSDGSWSYRCACPCSCCGCCALYSRWAPYQTGTAVRIHSVSGTVAGESNDSGGVIWMNKAPSYIKQLVMHCLEAEKGCSLGILGLWSIDIGTSWHFSNGLYKK